MKLLKRGSLFFGVFSVSVLLFLALIGTVNAKTNIINVKGGGFLGVQVERMSIADRDEFGVKSGVLVVKVLKDTSAWEAGLKKYDVIRFFNTIKIHRPEDLTEEVRKTNPGSGVTLKIVRDGKEKDIRVTIGKLKKEEYRYKNFGENIFRSFGGRVYLGVQIQSLNNDLASYFGIKKDGGALVIKLDKDAPAQKAGIKAGDIIVSVNKEKIRNRDDLAKIIKKFEPGTKVKITLFRHKKRISVIAVLEKGKWNEFMNIIRFPKKGVFHMDVPGFDKDEIMIWENKVKEEAERRMGELKERLKSEQIMLNGKMNKELKEKMLRLKEKLMAERVKLNKDFKRLKARSFLLKENKKRMKELKKIEELKRSEKYIYI